MSKGKIVVFDDKTDELVYHPDLFNVSNVFKVRSLPTDEQIDKLVLIINCPDCKKNNLRKIGYERISKQSALFVRCLDCSNPIFTFFSETKLSSPDIGIVMCSSKEQSYREEIEGLNCNQCKNKLQVEYDIFAEKFDIKTIMPMILRCTKCPDISYNIIYWDRPLYYYRKASQIIDEVINVSPKAALVFILSALETYLQKAWYFQSEFHKELVNKRIINFQNLKEIRNYYRLSMNIDIYEIVASNDNWDLLTQSYKKRHGIIHNAGFDKSYNEIGVSSTEVGKLRETVEDFTKDLNDLLEKRGLL
ncbi:hypothetical protein CEE37_04260 [candidate division LCP-89 bacterium B3_LCP]|uniref:Uncharacterized protein n=1 Tax=candidate division LCP-89 bacterium B3_LCP TaxID=2012998 RepID=A0A532V3R1_UNCL8|nr:MAG: hypothetical protein CEE37_04260 [candidate division LCP-89 bacterium B3_LCP]